ncbi:hypothetical protein BDV18DRAFT_68565 [Aspergillus unguis]
MDKEMHAVTIREVSPRDGLQNIPFPIPTETKIELIDRLTRTGLRTIELTSVVSSKAVPQLADWREIVASHVVRSKQGGECNESEGSNPSSRSMSRSSICSDESYSRPNPQLLLPVLIPNLQGLRLLQPHFSPPAISVFVSATLPFSLTNTHCTIAEGLARARAVTHAAKESGTAWVRGYISCITRDPITCSPTPHSSVLQCAEYLLDSGVDEVVLSDTDGSGTAASVDSLLMYLKDNGVDMDNMAGHFHDTFHRGLENVWAAYCHGVRVFDGSIAGLGGCPFAPGAKGNTDTGEMVQMFEQRGIPTGVDRAVLAETGRWIKEEIGELEAAYKMEKLRDKRDSGCWTDEKTSIMDKNSGHWSALTRPIMFQQ